MPVKIDEKYEGTVVSAQVTVSQEKGTKGLGIIVNTIDGNVDRTYYLTPGTKDFVTKTLKEAFGVTDAQLVSGEFWRGIGGFLKGKLCSITTEAVKDASGNVRLSHAGHPYATIKWLNPSRLGKAASSKEVDDVVSLFGGESSDSGSDAPPDNDWGGEAQPTF